MWKNIIAVLLMTLLILAAPLLSQCVNKKIAPSNAAAKAKAQSFASQNTGDTYAL